MESLKTCARCRTQLPADAPGGLCLKCVFDHMLSGWSDEPQPQPAEGGDDAAAGPKYLGDYELLEEMARGGMGVVFRARQLSLNRLVAVKLILAGELASAASVERFYAEAELAAGLDHPNIVPIYEVGEHAGQHFFSMKLIEGRSLDVAAAEEPLSPQRSAQLMVLLARAVHYAHQHGVLHRDIKPKNILLDADGQPHLTDFGLAKSLEQEGGLTRTLAVIGTPSYMSPEQAAGETKRLTTAADVYGLGAVLYELLAGAPPFAGASTMETVRLVLEKEPRHPSVLRRSIPRELETICLKCLEKRPASRYGSAEALADDLQRWLEHKPILAHPTTPAQWAIKWARRQPALAALVGFGAVSVTAFVVLLLVSKAGLRQERDFAVAQQKLVAQEQAITRQNLYAADMYLVQHAMADGYYGLAQRTLEGWRSVGAWSVERAAAGLASPIHPSAPAVDLRGFEWRYFWKLSHPESLFSFGDGSNHIEHLAVSPDGRTLALAAREGVVELWDLSTRQRIAGPPRHGAPPSEIAFSPDGQLLATGGDDGHLHFWNVRERRVSHDLEAVHPRFAFCPRGTLLAIGKAGKEVELWDYARLQQRSVLPGSRSPLAFSSDGKLLATGSTNLVVMQWESDTSQLLKTIASPERASQLCFSPDGRKLAACGEGLWVFDLETSRVIAEPRGHATTVWDVKFSPDGSQLATASWDQTVRVWDTSNWQQKALFIGHGAEVWALDYTPDGSTLISGGHDGKVRAWSAQTLEDADWSSRNRLENASRTFFSPRGQRAIVIGADYQATLLDCATAQPRVMAHTNQPVCFCLGVLDESGVFARLVPEERVVEQVDLLTATVRHQVKVALLEGEIKSACLSPDGARIALGYTSGQVLLLNATSGAVIKQEQAHSLTVFDVVFSHDCRTLVSAGDQIARLWDAGSLRPLATLVGHRREVCNAAFSPDDSLLATACWDGTVKLWNLPAGTEAATLSGHRNGVLMVNFSPDGRTLASRGDDPIVKFWHVATHRELTTFAYTNKVGFCTFSPDGRHFASGGPHLPLSLLYAPSLSECDSPSGGP
jgi:WD40 repeat protein